MNNEYVFQMDLRDDRLKHAKQSLEKDDKVPNISTYESRRNDYSEFQNAFNTYPIPVTNKYLELIQSADAKKQT